MDLAEQQIQRYEATQYVRVSIERLQTVADARNLPVDAVFALERESDGGPPGGAAIPALASPTPVGVGSIMATSDQRPATSSPRPDRWALLRCVNRA